MTKFHEMRHIYKISLTPLPKILNEIVRNFEEKYQRASIMTSVNLKTHILVGNH